jgi:hypothetical protein
LYQATAPGRCTLWMLWLKEVSWLKMSTMIYSPTYTARQQMQAALWSPAVGYKGGRKQLARPNLKPSPCRPQTFG